MIGLKEGDQKFWGPDPLVIQQLCERIPDGAQVLEIGPGPHPFPRATEFVDIKDFGVGLKVTRCDCNRERLPFSDRQFDFVYARHVLEDMYNPFLLCDEMQRVGKAGFIETPSPLVEYCRGVDGGSPPWRGYNHHRYLVWPSNGTLQLMGKFPMIEHVDIDVEAQLVPLLAHGPALWNTRFSWDVGFKYKHLECPMDFLLPNDYAAMVMRSIREWHADLKTSHRRQ